MVQIEAYNSNLVGYCRYINYGKEYLYNAYDVITGLHIDPVLACDYLTKYPSQLYIIDTIKGSIERSNNGKVIALDYSYIDSETYLYLLTASPLYTDSNYFDTYEIQDPSKLSNDNLKYSANLTHFKFVLSLDINMGLNTLK